jgi:stress response protein YsnF
MEGHNLVAVYSSRAAAERAQNRLIQADIPAGDIRLGDSDALPVSRAETITAVAPERREGFWDWLFGRDIPEEHRSWYETNLRQGRTALSVLVRNETQRQLVEQILEEFSPLAFEGETMAAPAAASATYPSGMAETRPLPEMERLQETPLRSDTLASEAARLDRTGQTEEEVIPVAKEELAIGKRASERRYRIRTYVVETPVEREVTLRDERVVVERRPVTGDHVVGSPHIPQEREIEVIERHEEPVVEKQVRNVEEVVVHKEATERTETVRDTVRETRVDVENEAGAPAENLGSTIPADRHRP